MCAVCRVWLEAFDVEMDGMDAVLIFRVKFARFFIALMGIVISLIVLISILVTNVVSSVSECERIKGQEQGEG